MICRECGFVFTNPAPPQSELDAYYRDCFPAFPRQEPDFSSEARLALLGHYSRDSGAFVEVGGARTANDNSRALLDHGHFSLPEDAVLVDSDPSRRSSAGGRP